MANNNKSYEQGIKNSWSLISFARAHGPQMKVAPFVNKDTGESFNSCVFINDERELTLVNFSSNLGELTPQQIANQKNDLQVVQLESGSYKLCKAGSDTWQEVNLGL